MLSGECRDLLPGQVVQFAAEYLMDRLADFLFFQMLIQPLAQNLEAPQGG